MLKLSRPFAVLFATLLLAAACSSGEGNAVETGTESSEPSETTESSSSATSSSGPTESPLGDLLGIPITNDDEMEEFFGQMQRDAERKISECMLAEGFEYNVVDYGAAAGSALQAKKTARNTSSNTGSALRRSVRGSVREFPRLRRPKPGVRRDIERGRSRGVSSSASGRAA